MKIPCLEGNIQPQQKWKGFQDGNTISKKGNRVPKQTTAGWELLVKWNDNTTTWVPLKDPKDRNLIKLTEYAIVNKINNEQAF